MFFFWDVFFSGDQFHHTALHIVAPLVAIQDRTGRLRSSPSTVCTSHTYRRAGCWWWCFLQTSNKRKEHAVGASWSVQFSSGYSKFSSGLFYFFDHYIQSSGLVTKDVCLLGGTVRSSRLRSVSEINHTPLADGKASLDPLRSIQFRGGFVALTQGLAGYEHNGFGPTNRLHHTTHDCCDYFQVLQKSAIVVAVFSVASCQHMCC